MTDRRHGLQATAQIHRRQAMEFKKAGLADG